MFIDHFNTFTCDGDSIVCYIDGFAARAWIEHDNDARAPDKRHDGFWPSLDPKSAGYIGAKSKATLARETKAAQAVMDAWKADEWWYVGVCVQVTKEGVELTGKYSNALWGMECNYPATKKTPHPNHILRETANELLGQALIEAKEKLAVLCKCPGAPA